MARVLITGGAGFIGSHAADALLASGHDVKLFDNLTPQVHGTRHARPAYLADDAELIVGDIRDERAVRRALCGVDKVLHLAAVVGVGQSMYDIEPYVRTNELGTAMLMQALSRHPVERLVVASSMSIYGEGLYRDCNHLECAADERSVEQLHEGDWELRDPFGRRLDPMPTPESKPPSLSSIYALNKYAQERMCLITGRAYGIPTVALRFFNVFGPRQALSNPYTGVLAIFASRLLNNRPPLVFEDGLQRRDFIHVRDVARACLAALESSHANEAFNIGSGHDRTILSIARSLSQVMERTDISPEITGKYRAGDIRHCFADISKSRALLGFAPKVAFEDGLAELAGYLVDQVADDHTERAAEEMSRRGLVA
ncbi:NAD-dependent epimerase/dehydratase family protein [Bradyrhizobium sp. ORS 111]|uniref:NAD-dependent epimerase/dehydratase family protein n=1 Tax=Bradyrhizobium sp. ORS 111 TaxID=1685958 RepID=UPI003890CE54